MCKNGVFVGGVGGVRKVRVSGSRGRVSGGGELELSVSVNSDKYGGESVIWRIGEGDGKGSI